MRAKEYLSRYESCERRIEAKQDKVREFRAIAISMSLEFGERVQTSLQENKKQSIITAYMDIENEILEEILRLKKIMKSITNIINMLENQDEREVLERRYINRQGFSVIAEKMYICERQIYRIHGKALEKIQKILEK